MTIQDLEGVYTPTNQEIAVGRYNEGDGFNPMDEEDYLWKGSLDEADHSKYYKVNIADVHYDIDLDILVVSLDDVAEDRIVNDKDYNLFAPRVKEMFDMGYTIEQTCGCIHDLYEDYEINEATEEALYALADPEDKMTIAPAEVVIGFDNPLEKKL